MTISTEVRKAGPFIGNDSASVFPFAFKVFKAADLIVVRRQDNIGEETTLVLDSDYHVTLNGNQDTTPGGVVTLVAGALASGFTLVVSSELPYLQTTDLTNQGGFYPKVITNALDRLTIFCQQLAETTGRTLKLPITAPTNIGTEIPLPNPSELIAWDETGTRLTTVSPQSLVTSIAYGSATADLFAGDGVTTTFPLSTNPASVNNLDVSVGGFSQRPVQGGIGDYSWNGGASITFAVPPPAPTILGDKNVLVRYMQAIPVSDSEALHAQTREALRRSYAEAGYNLVDGSFETGGTLASTTDVLLLESTGAAYAWTGAYPVGGYDVAPGFDPIGVVGFELRTDVVLADRLSAPDGSNLIGAATYAQIRAYSGSSSRINCVGRTNIFDGAGGLFAVDVTDTTTIDDDGYCLVDANGRRWKRIGFTAIDPCWYGAVSDYGTTTKTGTSSSLAFFKAVSLAAAGVKPEWQNGEDYKEICKTVRPRTGNYKFTTSVPIPSGVIVDLNQSLIGGDGFSDSDCEAFVTGYVDTDGVLKSNLSLGDEIGRVIGAKLINWRAVNLKRFFNAKNFNEGSVCEFGYAYDVRQVILAKRSFYSAIRNSVSRGAAGGTTLHAFEFDSFVNVMDVSGLVSTTRTNQVKVSGGANGLDISRQSYEGGQNGLELDGEVYPATVTNNYFEVLAGIGLYAGDGSAKRNVIIDSNWFYSVGTAIFARNMQGGKIGEGNYFGDNVTVNVNMQDEVSTAKVEIPPKRVSHTSTSLKPAFPSDKYLLGQAADVKYRVHIYNNATGETVAAQNYSGDRPIDFSYSGKQGFVAGKVAFCDHSKTAGTTFNVVIDTKIAYDNYAMWCFCLTITDNAASHRISGRGYGNSAYLDINTGSKTVTASNNAGYLQLTISSFSNPSELYSCEGIVRHM